MAQEKEFPEREDTIRAIRTLAPTSSMKMLDGAVLFAVKIPWQLAGAIIKHLNTANIRPLDHGDAMEYARDMIQDQWASCYDPIAFTADWVLYNGQHRLLASWRSQKSHYWIVVMNGKPDMRKSIDGGKKRSISQTHGLPNATASIVNFTMLLETRCQNKKVTRASKLERHAKDAGVFDHYAGYFARYPLLRESHVGGAFAFAEVYRPRESLRIRQVAEDIAGGANLLQCSRLIDGKIVERRRIGSNVHSLPVRYAEAGLILRALQAHLLGTDLQKLEPHPGTLDWFCPVPPAQAAE